MTPEEKAIRERHVEDLFRCHCPMCGVETTCAGCRLPWPCDTVQAFAFLDAARVGKWHHDPDAPPEHFCEDCDRVVRQLGLAVIERDAERAEVERLDMTRPEVINDAFAAGQESERARIAEEVRGLDTHEVLLDGDSIVDCVPLCDVLALIEGVDHE